MFRSLGITLLLLISTLSFADQRHTFSNLTLHYGPNNGPFETITIRDQPLHLIVFTQRAREALAQSPHLESAINRLDVSQYLINSQHQLQSAELVFTTEQGDRKSETLYFNDQVDVDFALLSAAAMTYLAAALPDHLQSMVAEFNALWNDPLAHGDHLPEVMYLKLNSVNQFTTNPPSMGIVVPGEDSAVTQGPCELDGYCGFGPARFCQGNESDPYGCPCSSSGEYNPYQGCCITHTRQAEECVYGFSQTQENCHQSCYDSGLH